MTKNEIIKKIKEHIKDVEANIDLVGLDYVEGCVDAYQVVLAMLKDLENEDVYNINIGEKI